MNKTAQNFLKLQELVATLRHPDGCPWDRKQTPESFKSYLLEESHELLEAIEQNSPDHIKEELGDLLFQLVFLNQLYEEQGCFTLAEVIEGIIEKMVRRHPHVFGDEKVSSEAEQRQNWQKIKAKEKKTAASHSDLLKAVPRSLPALRRAQRVSERAAQTGFDWRHQREIFAKLEEEIDEFRQALAAQDQENMVEELGDILFMLVNLGRFANINTEDALQAATAKFIRRFAKMEKQLENSDHSLPDLNTEQLLALWTAAKKV